MTGGITATIVGTEARRPVPVTWAVWPAADANGTLGTEPAAHCADEAAALRLAGESWPWGACVQRRTPDGDEWNFGNGWHRRVEDALAATEPLHGRCCIVVTGDRDHDHAGVIRRRRDGLVVSTPGGREIPIGHDDIDEDRVRVVDDAPDHELGAILAAAQAADARYDPGPDPDDSIIPRRDRGRDDD